MSWPIFRSSSPAPGNSICPGTWNSGLTWKWFNPDSLPPPPAHLHPGQKQSLGGRGCFYWWQPAPRRKRTFVLLPHNRDETRLHNRLISPQSPLICRLPGDAPSFFCVNEHVAFWVTLGATVEVTALELEHSAAFWVITINTVACNEPFASVAAHTAPNGYVFHASCLRSRPNNGRRWCNSRKDRKLFRTGMLGPKCLSPCRCFWFVRLCTFFCDVKDGKLWSVIKKRVLSRSQGSLGGGLFLPPCHLGKKWPWRAKTPSPDTS